MSRPNHGKQLAATVVLSRIRWTRLAIIHEGAKLGLCASSSLKAMSECDDIEAYPKSRKIGDEIQWFEFKLPPVKDTPYAEFTGKFVLYTFGILLACKEMSDIIESWFN